MQKIYIYSKGGKIITLRKHEGGKRVKDFNELIEQHQSKPALKCYYASRVEAAKRIKIRRRIVFDLKP